MDINEIKNLIEIDGGKFIIVEDGKPAMVIIGFEEYKQKLIDKKISPIKKEPAFAKATAGEQRAVPKEFESEPLKLEDLPL